MKQIAKATLAAAIAFAALPNSVIASSDPSSDSSSDPSLSGRLRGRYAYNLQQVCIFTDASGFDATLQPKNPQASRIESTSSAGIYTFDGHGSVTLNGTSLGIRGPAYTGTGEETVTPLVNPRTASAIGSYRLTHGGRVTIIFTNVVLGFSNETLTIDQIPLSGRVGLDDKTLVKMLVLSIPEPTVQTIRSSTGAIAGFRLCERSEVVVKQP